jgi:hypothetical protein
MYRPGLRLVDSSIQEGGRYGSGPLSSSRSLVQVIPSNHPPLSTADFDGINASVNPSYSTGTGTGSCAERVSVAMTSSKDRHRRRSYMWKGDGIKKKQGNLDDAKQSLGERRHLDISKAMTTDSQLSSVRSVEVPSATHIYTHTNTRQRHDIPGSTWSSGCFRFLCKGGV